MITAQEELLKLRWRLRGCVANIVPNKPRAPIFGYHFFVKSRPIIRVNTFNFKLRLHISGPNLKVVSKTMPLAKKVRVNVVICVCGSMHMCAYNCI
jgi:hypothetical protein